MNVNLETCTVVVFGLCLVVFLESTNHGLGPQIVLLLSTPNGSFGRRWDLR